MIIIHSTIQINNSTTIPKSQHCKFNSLLSCQLYKSPKKLNLFLQKGWISTKNLGKIFKYFKYLEMGCLYNASSIVDNIWKWSQWISILSNRIIVVHDYHTFNDYQIIIGIEDEWDGSWCIVQLK